MRNLLIAAFVATSGLSNVEATGADFGDESTQRGSISAGQLAEMGLGGMTPISDGQALQIRGSGYVLVSGFSFVRGGVPDGYLRRDSSFARGRSSSFTRIGSPTFRISGGSFGYAFAYAQ